VDVHHHPLTIDVGDVEVRAFEQPQPARVDHCQTHAVDRNPHQREDTSHLVPTQHHRQLVRAGRAHEPKRRPLSTQGLFEEEPDATQGDRRRGAGHLLLIRQVQEVLAQLLLGQATRRGVEMVGELANGSDVALLRPCGQPPELHILQHPLT
jgi:hypothetical protein